MKFALVNHSTLVSEADAHLIARAVDQQLGAVAHAWDHQRPSVAVEVPEPGDVQLVLLDDSDQAGALGYHDVTPEGEVYAAIFVRDSIADIAGVDPASLQGVQPSDLVLRTVASVTSHEALEAEGDPEANLWADGPDGREWAVELCDAVESSSYLVDVDGTAVSVSNFLLPAYFEASTPPGAQVDEMAVIQTGPFTIAPDGYAITRTEGKVEQRFGDELADWRRARHEAAALTSRTGWRLLLSTPPAAEAASDDDPGAADTAGPETPPEGTEQPDGEVELAVVLTAEEAAAFEAELEASRISHPAFPGQPGHAAIEQDNVSRPGSEITKTDGRRSVHDTAER